MTKQKHIRDSQRFSIMQDDMRFCFICGRYLRQGEGALHEVFWGYANRQKSKDYGLVVKLCNPHHDPDSPISVHHNPAGELNNKLRQKAKQAFKEKYPDKDFREIFGRNYEDTSERR